MPQECSVLLGEKSALRDEIKHLKLCQLNYFTISVTATGALLGLGSKIGSEEASGLLYFSPLFIILPCWWIFFDKATTIARIVGYMTILDRLLSDCPQGESSYRYVGWEAALYYYRNRPVKLRPSIKSRLLRWARGVWFGLSRVLTYRTSHRYWSINYYTYASLSFICWGLGSGVLPGGPIDGGSLTTTSIVLLIVITISLVYNLYLAGDLIKGGRCYNAHVRAWDEVMKAENAGMVLQFSAEETKPPNLAAQPEGQRTDVRRPRG